MQRNRIARRTHSSRIYDVDYAGMVTDPGKTVTELYDSMYSPMSASFRAALTAYARSHPIGRHGAHSYSLDAAPIDAATVQRRLAS